MTFNFAQLLLILAVTQASSSCDWFSAAQTNPALDYFSRIILWRIWQLDQLCKHTFSLLPAYTLPYVSTYLPKNEDKVGEFLQFYADKVERELMDNWISNYTYNPVKFQWDPEELTKEAMMAHYMEANRTVASLEDFRNDIFKSIEEGNIYNMYNTLKDPDLNRPESLTTLKTEEWLFIYDALYCTLTRRNSSESSVNVTVFRQMMNTDGWENTDDDRINPVLAKLTDRGINAAKDLVWLYQKQKENFLHSFTEEMKAYEDTVHQFLAGKLPKLTNLIFEILGKVKSEMFFQNINSLFNAACDQRIKNIWNQVDTTLAKLASKLHFMKKSINANNKVDVFIFISELNSNLGEVKKELQNIIKRGFKAVKEMLDDKGNTKILLDSFLPIFFPACKQNDACQNKKLILLQHSKILAGGILRAFVKMERFDKLIYEIHRRVNGEFYTNPNLCGVDCSRDCPDIKKLDYEEGCWSEEACNKNLFFDIEKC